MSDIDAEIRAEFGALLAGKEARPFVDAPCPDCGRIGGFLRNDDGSPWPERCIPCERGGGGQDDYCETCGDLVDGNGTMVVAESADGGFTSEWHFCVKHAPQGGDPLRRTG